jgi:hypothetical protein
MVLAEEAARRLRCVLCWAGEITDEMLSKIIIDPRSRHYAPHHTQ